MKRYLIFVVVFAAVLAVAQQPTTNPPNNWTAPYNLFSPNPPGASNLPTWGSWTMNHFKVLDAPMADNGAGWYDLTSYLGTGNTWMQYIDSCSQIPVAMSDFLFNVGDDYPWITDPEGLLLHYTQDFTLGPTYTQMDSFDVYEAGSSLGQTGSSKATCTATACYLDNGVFTLVSGTYVDHTVDSQQIPSPVSFAVTQDLLIGSGVAFDLANFTVTSASTGTVTYKYWNGTTLAALTPSSDTTSGMTTTGTVKFVPPSDWKRHIVNGSHSKFWIEVEIASGSFSVSGIKGDDLTTGGLARGWNPATCVSGHANIGDPDLEYCAVPNSSSTARFRSQARVQGYGQSNRFYHNPSNKQMNGATSTLTQPYYFAHLIKLWRTSPNGFPAMNGIFFDNGGRYPENLGINSSMLANTDFGNGYSAWQQATTDVWKSLLPIAAGMTNPPFIMQNAAYPNGNSSEPTQYPAPYYRLNSTALPMYLEENLSDVTQSINSSSLAALNVCTDITWCPAGVGINTINTIDIWEVRATGGLYGLKDGAGSAVTNWHVWDKENRDPMAALAMHKLVMNPNVWFNYNLLNAYDFVDDYYYFAPTPAKIAAPGVSGPGGTGVPTLCNASVCTIPLTQALGVTGSTSNFRNYIRIGGAGGDVVPVTSLSGTSLTTISSNVSAITQAWATDGSVDVEVVTNSNISLDPTLHTPVFAWGAWFPAMDVDLGVPDSSHGFNYPCSGTNFGATGTPATGTTCYAATGISIKGATSACTATPSTCSPLVRRDFKGGPHGNVIVLLRLLAPSNNIPNITASDEYDTPSSPIALGAYYYPLNSDGTFGASTNTATLRGGEAGIYVQNTGSGQYFFPFK